MEYISPTPVGRKEAGAELSMPDDSLSVAAFIRNVAELAVWNVDSTNIGNECDPPSDGILDSHLTLMRLIDQARKLLGAISISTNH